ncbi:hypothetical protein [Paenibacillus naphthalenovorans]|uniref:hypothetical protein n=1 Tax=Paenibacillus naphthalenovorans TaxID=162209 RepID=UPI003D2E2973
MGLLYDAVHYPMKVEGGSKISLPALRISCLARLDENRIVAATFGQGTYAQSADGEWEAMNSGLPERTVTYRLQALNGKLYAATDRGLFAWSSGAWHPTGLTMPCYRVLEGSSILAGTAIGLTQQADDHWDLSAFPNRAVYDLLSSPQFLFVGYAKGMAFYDYLTGQWHEFHLDSPVTSLSVCQGRLLGVTAKGELVLGNRRGGFSTIRFDDKFFYRWVQVGPHILACSSSGLYKMVLHQENPVLYSIGIRGAVTDAIELGNRLVVSTLHYGLVSLPFS